MLEIRTYNINDTILSVTPLNNEEIDVLNNYGISNYITFDGLGVNLLDESKKFYEETDYKGLRSPLSNENKEIVGYDGGIEIVFNLNHTADLPITLIFNNDNCTELRIEHTTATGGMKGYTQKVNGNIVTLYLDTTTYRWLIYPTKTKNEQERVTLEGVIDGTVNNFNKFKSHNLIEEINVLSDDLPINQFQATFINPEHLPLGKKTPLTLLSNGKYFGTFYITNSKKSNRNFYDITAQNEIGLLNGEEYIDWKSTNISLLDFTSQLSPNIILEDETKYNIFGYIPVETKRFALCAACFGCGLMINNSRSNNIILQKIPTEISSVILTKDRRIIGDATLELTEPIISASISFPNDVDFSETGSVTLSGEADMGHMHFFEDAPVLIYEGSGNVIYYGESDNYVEYKAKNENITFSYYKYKYLTNVEIVENLLETEGKTKEYKSFQIRGGIVGNDGYITRISRSEDVLKYIQSRGRVNAKIRLRGEKVGDLIQIETAWDGIITGIITKMDITFGYEDIANIEVLEWNL